MDLDDAAMAVHEQMPHLGIETPSQLVDYFERHRTYGWRAALLS
jgi:hypothetical protein